MVTFVTAFISPRANDYEREERRLTAMLRERFPADSAAVMRKLVAWRSAHPVPKVGLDEVADRIDHVRGIAGVDHVGIGSDFDGMGERTIEGLEDVATFPALLAELAKRGWTEGDLRKLAGENILRVLEQAERVAARLRRQRPASIQTITRSATQ